MKLQSSVEDYRRVEKAILFLDKNFRRQPGLKEIAQTVALSEYHFQRLFRRWAGISPKRFLQLLTIEYAKQVMQGSGSLLDVSYKTGLSSAGRLHDLFVNVEAVTPGEFRKRGDQLKIVYGVHPSPFGECLLAVTDRGICNLEFVGNTDQEKIVGALLKQWPNAAISYNPAITTPFIERIFGSGTHNPMLPLYLKGTNFQIKVWKALLKIPRGAIVSYKNIAQNIGNPDAVRAVANAVAHNPVAFLIPCHRVIRKTGAVGGYRWGTARKKAILALEAGRPW